MREGRPFVILKAATSLDGCIAEAPGRADAADVGGGATGTRTRVRAEVDAIGVGVGHDPRRRSAADGARRVPGAAADAGDLRPAAADAAGGARALDTRRRACHHRDDGGGGARAESRAARSKRAAREIEVADGRHASARRCSGWRARRFGSLLLEGRRRAPRGGVGRGCGRFRAAVRHAARARRRRRAAARRAARFRRAALVERRVEPLGPDVLIEGYVHGPR